MHVIFDRFHEDGADYLLFFGYTACQAISNRGAYD
jgi:hypothetical protein